eukprot:1066354-Prymnesium_polylepis.1
MGMCGGQLRSSDCTRKAMSAELARARLQQAARGWLARRGVERGLARCLAEWEVPGWLAASERELER